MKKLFFPLLMVLFAMSSCTIEQQVHFNNDRTGTNTTLIDMSGMMEMAGEMGGDSTSDGGESLFGSPEMQESLEEMRQMEGISNVRVEEDTKKGIYKIAMDFTDANMLNQTGDPASMMGGNADGPKVAEDHQYWQFKGKKVIYDFPSEAFQELKEDPEYDPSMMGMFQYKFTVSFDTPIKKVKGNDDVVISSDRKKLTFETDFGKLISGEASPSMTIILSKKI